MPRPFKTSTAQELRSSFEQFKTNAELLGILRNELHLRSSLGARDLLAEVNAALATLQPNLPQSESPGLAFTQLSPDSPQAKAAAIKIAELRQQLLDLSNRNRLLNFKHTANSGRYVRVVDESAPNLFNEVLADAKIELVPIPNPPDEPDDEKTEEFRSACNQALLTDKSYLKDAGDIADSGGDDAEARLRSAQRALRDRLRRRLRLPTRAQSIPSLRDYAIRLGIKPDYDLDGSGRGRCRRENQWQTLMGGEDLARRLSGIEHAAREAQQEFGIETLYLVFGFLEWYPPTPGGEAEQMLLSPLVLQLTSIQKRRNAGPRTVRGRRLLEAEAGTTSDRSHESYVIAASDAEEPTVNLTLRERLKQDMRLLLPELDPEEPDLSVFFEEVRRAIRSYPNWRVRQFVTLTHLSFSRLPMWRDLDSDDDQLLPPHQHPLLGELFGGKTPEPADAPAPLSKTRGLVPALVLDADYSQYAAIAAVLSGRNTVIQGPPGTGKSQTIANTIAAAMWQGKSVLFVAEKLVALQVVHKRLAEAHLGDFILELHSAKAGKKPVIESIRKRITPSGDLRRTLDNEDTRARHRQSEDALDAYAAAINSPFGKIGWTLHDIVWRYFATQDLPLPNRLLSFEFTDAESWTTHDRSSRCAAVNQWAQLLTRSARDPVGPGGQHPWSWVSNEDAHVADQNRIISTARQLAAALDELVHFLDKTRLIDSRTVAGLVQFGLGLRNLGARPAGIKPGMWTLATAADSACVVKLILETHRVLEDALATVRAIAPLLLQEDNPTPALGDLDALLAALAPWQEASTVDSLRARHSATASLLADLPKVAEMLSGMAALVGTDIEDHASISTIATLIELAALTPPCALGRSMAWQDDNAASLVLDAVSKIESLRSSREQIRGLTTFDFDSLSSAAIDAAVAKLARSSFFSWPFNTQLRNARRLAREIAPDRDNHQRLSLLRSISDLKHATNELQSHAAHSVAGTLLAGISTNTDDMRALCGWVDRVREATPIIPPINLRVRSVLLAFGRDLYSLARTLVADQWPQRLRELSRICQIANVSFAALTNLLRREQISLESALASTAKWQWVGLLNSDRIRIVLAALESVRQAKTLLARHVEAAALFLPDTTVGCRNLNLVHSAIGRIAATGLSNQWRQQLCAEDGAPAWDLIHNHASLLSSLLDGIQSPLASLAPLADPAGRLASAWLAEPIDDLRSRLHAALSAESSLSTRCECLANHALLRDSGLLSFVNAIDSPPDSPTQVGELLDRLLIRSLCHAAFDRVPALKPFRHTSPGEIRQRFRQYDEELKTLDRTALITRLLDRQPPQGNALGRVSERTEMALLEYVCGLQSPRTPVRDLIRRSGKALQAIKPCFMMSPLSVAQLVSRRDISFDLVIFDEASQIRPEDGLSALARARQFVVVGDSQQLPPTSFGLKSVDGPEQDDEDEEDESPVVESILELSAAAYGQGAMLTWHYRSRDPILIAFSNKEFYEHKLHLFPAPRHRSPATGVHYVSVPGIYSARTNLVEAQACARAAIAFMRAYPNRSLGIVALNRPQADLIELQLDRLISDHPHALEYCSHWEEGIEPLFVKNLESVQGDERDVIFISTVFAHDDQGNFFQRFGPINSKVGHRRLNVLFTRAKYQLVVFSSMPIEKITTHDGCHWGVRVLKEYLQFARSGTLETGFKSGRPTESPFEDAVMSAFKTEGFQCEPQIGVAGFFIDLAVRSSAHPDHFIIGIECDGAAYHSSRHARDRDRLRQQILESLGWTIYRVWSSDWFANPKQELRKLISAVREQVRKTPTSDPEPQLPFLMPRGTPPHATPTRPNPVSPPQLKPEAQHPHSPKPATGVVPARPPVTPTAEEIVSQLKHSRLRGFFSRDDISRLVLAFLQPSGRMGREELTQKILQALGLPEHHGKRVDSALETLDLEGKVLFGDPVLLLLRN